MERPSSREEASFDEVQFAINTTAHMVASSALRSRVA